jgi:hypothetical protein
VPAGTKRKRREVSAVPDQGAETARRAMRNVERWTSANRRLGGSIGGHGRVGSLVWLHLMSARKYSNLSGRKRLTTLLSDVGQYNMTASCRCPSSFASRGSGQRRGSSADGGESLEHSFPRWLAAGNAGSCPPLPSRWSAQQDWPDSRQFVACPGN